MNAISGYGNFVPFCMLNTESGNFLLTSRSSHYLIVTNHQNILGQPANYRTIVPRVGEYGMRTVGLQFEDSCYRKDSCPDQNSELRSLGRPAHSQSQYRMAYSGLAKHVHNFYFFKFLLNLKF